MMAMKKLLEREPGEIEMLLPWHAAGTLNARDARRVEEALARDPELSRQFAVIREEYAETIGLNESLGAPSARAMQSLFAAIDAEPERKPAGSVGISRGVARLFAALTPRTLAWSAGLAALVLLAQAGVIGAMLMRSSPGSFQTASLDADGPVTRGLRSEAPLRALVQFAPDARVADITALLDSYHATIIDARGGMFRLQFGKREMAQDEAAALLRRLEAEKIVRVAVAAP
jgi:anti-sigma factor RsiW